MALDANRLAIPIKAAFVAIGAAPANPATTQLALDLATAIVNEFKNNAELVIDIGPPPTGTIK